MAARLALVGDVMLGRSMNAVIAREPPGYVWGSALPLLRRVDAVVANLETTITRLTEAPFLGRAFHFALEPRLAARALLSPPFAAKPLLKHCSLANNHAMDFGAVSLLDTRRHLQSMGVSHAGTGVTLKDAQQAAFVDVNGVRLGFLSATDHPREYAASRAAPGAWYIHSRTTQDEAVAIAKRTRAQCDALVFSLHWGPNYVDAVTSEQRALAHRLVDEGGVSIIHGHSAHHVLPVEQYRDALIFYGLGDFVDDYAVDPKYRNDLACIAEVSVLKGRHYSEVPRVRLEAVHPTRIERYRVNVLAPSEADYTRVLHHMRVSHTPTVR